MPFRGSGSKPVYRRDPQGNIIAVENIGSLTGGGKNDPLRLLKSIIKGNAKAGILSKADQKALAKLDIGEIKYKDMARFGLDDSLTKEQFREFKGMFKDLAGDKRLGKKDVRSLAKFAVGTARDNEIDRIDRGIDRLVPDGDEIETPQRGNLANLNMSIFAQAAVRRARGIKAATATGPRGDARYGKSLARISLGTGFV
jgi:hypothetical protein